MKLSRKAKRYDDAVLPGEFQGYEMFQEICAPLDGVLKGTLRHTDHGVDVGQITLECVNPRKLSFAKLQCKAEALTQQINYLKERLEIVDHDRRGMYIQLRSLPPYKDDHQIQFNEINIGKNKVVVKRVAFYRRDEQKRQVPMTLSEQEFQQLLEDIRHLIQ